jgi:hypothetical protein
MAARHVDAQQVCRTSRTGLQPNQILSKSDQKATGISSTGHGAVCGENWKSQPVTDNNPKSADSICAFRDYGNPKGRAGDFEKPRRNLLFMSIDKSRPRLTRQDHQPDPALTREAS